MAETARKRGRPRKNSTINEDTHKMEASNISPSARPTASSEGRRSRRRQKGSVGGFRNILTVTPKDPGFHNKYVTRWFKDTDEKGHKLLSAYNEDWDFVRADEVEVGENFVYKSKGAESIVRVPAGSNLDSGHWLFLMKKHRDWYDQDIIEKHRKIAEMEAYIDRKRDPNKVEDEGEGHSTDGLYGSAKTRWDA